MKYLYCLQTALRLLLSLHIDSNTTANMFLCSRSIHGTVNKHMIEAVRCNPDVKGYCVHALTAGDWIIGAGLLDLFRNPKTYAYEDTKPQANRESLPSACIRVMSMLSKARRLKSTLSMNFLREYQKKSNKPH